MVFQSSHIIDQRPRLIRTTAVVVARAAITAVVPDRPGRFPTKWL
jgi:hypothetical protein